MSPTGVKTVPPRGLFVLTVFFSAALVFMVQPMVAKLVLPLMGGSPAVWNTSMAFFQLALLVGYAYAHLLQRAGAVRRQAWIHGGALLVAALALPLRVHDLVGPPSSTHPNLWLIGVLGVSIGAPFAVLSATAPLVQAWFARTTGREPYPLYAASNLGSLLALIAYPVLMEPLLTVKAQTLGWTTGYGVFALLIGALALTVLRAPEIKVDKVEASAPVTWKSRLIWVVLAAIPSSLMLGVTMHLATDVASAPFLWVIPLTLYLATFVIAFQAKPLISPRATLFWQAGFLVTCVALAPFRATWMPLQFLVHLGSFFFTALMCHQALVARRPEAGRLTEFYLAMSVGGVLGGGFNAFVAPVIFNYVWEYPLVLALAALARPWGPWRIRAEAGVFLTVGVICAIAAPLAATFLPRHLPAIGKITSSDVVQMAIVVLLGFAAISAFVIRGQAFICFGLICVMSMAANVAADRAQVTRDWRSFFGVLELTQAPVPALGGMVHMLAHGTTLHGAQSTNPAYACKPLVYYTPSTPIGQVFLRQQDERPNGVRIGAVGLGTGTVSAYVRPVDWLTFFEIDPLVIKIANDPKNFTYTRCAEGKVDYVIGDARLTLSHQPDNTFDVLLIDAFSSDAVPTHMLTVEAVRTYLRKVKPDGIVILHLSNRHLDLNGPAQSVAGAAGGVGLMQKRRIINGEGMFWEADEDALIVGRSRQALAKYLADKRWYAADPTLARPWTDDYTNIPGALWRKMEERWRSGS
jgi:SAM-dependent methyltransferase